MTISQGQLAAKLGVSFQQVQKYEKGVNRVRAARLSQIAAILGVPVGFFYDGSNAKQEEVESLLFMDANFSLRLLRAYRAPSRTSSCGVASSPLRRRLPGSSRTLTNSRVARPEGDVVALRDSRNPGTRKSSWNLGGRLHIIAVMATAPDYYVFTFQTDERPFPWRWEVRRHSRPMGVRIGDGGYQSQAAAEFAGKRALQRFLVELAAEERRRR
jgi:transcriptional regulator with XRE-family HTH domain